jgi:hypothetical protein
MRLEFDFGEMFEMFCLAEEFPVLERPIGPPADDRGTPAPGSDVRSP